VVVVVFIRLLLSARFGSAPLRLGLGLTP